MRSLAPSGEGADNLTISSKEAGSLSGHIAGLVVLLLLSFSIGVAKGQWAGEGEASELAEQARQFQQQGKYTEATRLWEQVLAIFEQELGPVHPHVGYALIELSELSRQMGEYAQAVPMSQRALVIAEQAFGPEHSNTGAALNNLAVSYMEMHEYAQALPLFQRAVAISGTATYLVGLGSVYEAMRDYDKALPLYQRALAIQEQELGPEHPKTADSLTRVAGIYQATGDYRQLYEHALPLMQRALTIREQVSGPEHPLTALALNNLAGAYQTRYDYDQALPLYQRALAIFEQELGPDHSYTVTTLSNLGWLHQEMGDDVQALALLQRSLAINEQEFGSEHPDTALGLVSLAKVYEGMGDYPQALEYFQRALAAQEPTFTTILAVASERQKLLFAQDSQLPYLETLSLIHRHFPTDLLAVRSGLDWVLRYKGRVLHAQGRLQKTLAAYQEGDVLEAWERLNLQRSTLSRLLLRGGAGEQSGRALRAQISKLQVTIREEEEYLAQHSGLVAQELAQRELTAQRLAAELPQDTILVEVVRIPDWDEKKRNWADTSRYLAFLLTSDDTVSLIDLGEAARIEDKISQTLAEITASAAPEDLITATQRVDGHLAALYALLIRPMEAIIGSRRRLIVSPDGALNKVPFAALRTPDGRYLIEAMTLSYVTSGRDLLRRDTGSGATLDLLLVANPAFDERAVLRAGAGREAAVRAGDYGERFDPLPGTAEEARRIPLLVGGEMQILQGKAATESVIRRTTSPRILHIATHGFFLKDEEASPPEGRSAISFLDTGRVRGKGGIQKLGTRAASNPPPRVNPMVRSGLALAGANHAHEITTGDDGLLTALEVSGMNLFGTDLVVLSACETGMGEVQVGEGIFGLRRAFMLAGAKNLVMSLWAVNDQLALVQMEQFYRGYESGESVAEALRAAQLQSISLLREKTYASLGQAIAPVRLWAPFIVQQTGEARSGGRPVGGVFAYSWWNLAVLLSACIGLLVLARIRLTTVPSPGVDDPFAAKVPQREVAAPITPDNVSSHARLECQSPDSTLVREIALVRGDNLIGQGANCDVIISHPSIAAYHARIRKLPQGFVIFDLTGRTGTFVNGRRSSENLLKDGWVVRLGTVEFVFREGGSQP